MQNDETSENQGTIADPSARARLMKRWNDEAQDKLDGLLQEARILKGSQGGTNADRLLAQLTEANKLLGLAHRSLPRNYTLVKSTGRGGGFYLAKHGRKATAEDLGGDIGSGWLYEVLVYLDNLVAQMRPKQIQSGTSGEGGSPKQ